MVDYTKREDYECAASLIAVRLEERRECMRNPKSSSSDTGMLLNDDFSHGEFGKQARRIAQGKHLLLLAPQVPRRLPDPRSLNAASRHPMTIARKSARL